MDSCASRPWVPVRPICGVCLIFHFFEHAAAAMALAHALRTLLSSLA